MQTKDYFSFSIKLILILSILNSIHYNLWHLMSTSIFLLILIFSPQILKKYSSIKIPREFEIFLFIFIIITLITGKVGGIIAPIFFGIGTGLIALLIMFILYSSNQIKKNYFLITIFSFTFALSFGAILELLKHYLKILLNQPINEGIYSLAMINLTYVLFGGIIASITGFIYMKTHLKILEKAIKKFKNINSNLFKKTKSPEELIELIKIGENEKIEFKATLRTNLHTNKIDKKIEHSTLKTICGFLNSAGGTLIIGVNDSGKLSGIQKDNFENPDKFQLHLMNLLKQKIGKNHLSLLSIELIFIEEKNILKIECKKSPEPIFLKEGKEEEFFTRTGPSTTQLKGSELINYVQKRFNKK